MASIFTNIPSSFGQSAFAFVVILVILGASSLSHILLQRLIYYHKVRRIPYAHNVGFWKRWLSNEPRDSFLRDFGGLSKIGFDKV